jgi:hydroxyacylglutathione hydrolase
MFNVVPLRAFRDNYIWTLRHGQNVAVVDPGDAAPVIDYLNRERARLVAILATHHHADHVGGIAELRSRHAEVRVYGPRDEPIGTLTHPVGGGDTVALPEIDARFEVVDIPGHTRRHIAYYGAQTLFCGDTLFACGCGRVFEGTPEQMLASLSRLAALPDDTRVYCGHEYTLANIAFAKAVEPANEALAALEAEAKRVRAEDRPTLPSTIGREKATNPFLRCLVPEVAGAVEAYLGRRATSPVAVFAALREWKNRFH